MEMYKVFYFSNRLVFFLKKQLFLPQNNTIKQNLSKTSNEEIMNVVIPVRPALYENENRIAVFIPNQKEMIDLIKKVPQCRWSPSHQCWHFLKTPEHWAVFQTCFQDYTLNIQKNMPPLSIPASEMLEKPKLQLKSDYLNAFVVPSDEAMQNDILDKKEGESVSFIHKTPFSLEKVTYDGLKFIGIPIPSTDQISRDIVKKMEGRIWHPQEYLWLLPYNQATYDSLKAAFEGKLMPPTVKTFRTIKPPQYEPKLTLKFKTQSVENIPLFEKLNGMQQLAITKLENLLIEERKAYHTMKGYRNIMIHFLFFYKEVKPSQITTEQIKHYIVTRIKDENVSKSTQNQMISTFKAFYGRLLEQHYKVNDLYRPNKEQHLPKTLEPAEIVRLFAQVTNIKHKCMLMLMYGSGLRVGELVRLKWQDLDFIEKTVFIHNGKNYKDRYTILSENTISFLQKYKTDYKATDWVFESPDGGHYSERSVQQFFGDALAKARIDKQVSTHSLRHAFATQLLKAHTDLDFVRKVMGHASIKTTQIYLHVLKTDLTKTRSPLDDLNI